MREGFDYASRVLAPQYVGLIVRAARLQCWHQSESDYRQSCQQ